MASLNHTKIHTGTRERTAKHATMRDGQHPHNDNALTRIPLVAPGCEDAEQNLRHVTFARM